MRQSLEAKQSITVLQAKEFLDCAYERLPYVSDPAIIESSTETDDTIQLQYELARKIGDLTVRLLMTEERITPVDSVAMVSESFDIVLLTSQEDESELPYIKDESIYAVSRTIESGEIKLEYAYQNEVSYYDKKSKEWIIIPTYKDGLIETLEDQYCKGLVCQDEYEKMRKSIDQKDAAFMMMFEDEGPEDEFTVARFEKGKNIINKLK